MSTKSIKRKENTNPWTLGLSDLPKDKDGLIYVRQSSLVQVRNNIHSFEMQTDKFLEHFRDIGFTGWWLPLDGGVIENNHEPIVNDGLFTYAHKRISTHDLQGERQKPERVSRWGEVHALLRKVIKDDKGRTIYVSPEKGGTYRATNDAGLRHNYNFSVLVRTLDPIFLERFLERVESIDPAQFGDWEDEIDRQREAKQKLEERRGHLIKDQIADAKRKWQESMGVLKNPNIPKTEQMQIDLANECAGLEGKIAKLQKDLNPTAKEEEEEDEILYQLHDTA